MSDQVTHTPTPWVMGAGFDGLLTINAKVSGRNLRVLELCGNLKNPEVVADAEFTLLAVNSHDALTARVAELEAENERLRGSLMVVRAAIIRAPNDIITDTVWMPEEISMNETVVDFIDATLESEA